MGWHTSEPPASDEPPLPRHHTLSQSRTDAPTSKPLQTAIRVPPPLAGTDLLSPRTRSRSRSSSQASDPFGSFDSLTYAGGREDRASTAGIFELDTDAATSGSENDEPSTPHQTAPQRRPPFSRASSAMRQALGHRTTSSSQPWRNSLDRTSDGSSAHSSPRRCARSAPSHPFRVRWPWNLCYPTIMNLSAYHRLRTTLAQAARLGAWAPRCCSCRTRVLRRGGRRRPAPWGPLKAQAHRTHSRRTMPCTDARTRRAVCQSIRVCVDRPWVALTAWTLISSRRCAKE